MAEQAAIDAVKKEIPDDSDTLFGLDDSTIGAFLDGGLSSTKATLASWRAIAGKLTMTVDVTESGSSRQLGTTFDNAMKMVEYWQKLSDAEDKDADDDGLPDKPRARVHTAVRV